MEKTKVIMRIESYSNKDGILVLGCDPIVRSAINGLVNWCQEKYGSYIKLEIRVIIKEVLRIRANPIHFIK